MPTPHEILYREPPAFSDRRLFNRLAIAALVVSHLPMAFPAAIHLGRVARRQIRESGGRERGSGLALAGLLFGLAYTVLLYGSLVFLVMLPAVMG